MSHEKLKLVSYNLEREELQKRIETLLSAHESFEVVDVKSFKQSTVVDVIERSIESMGMTCRVRTRGRGVVAAALAVPTFGGSIAAGAAIAVHNLATKDPDYEVIKDMIGSDVRVIYFKNKGLVESFAGEMI